MSARLGVDLILSAGILREHRQPFSRCRCSTLILILCSSCCLDGPRLWQHDVVHLCKMHDGVHHLEVSNTRAQVHRTRVIESTAASASLAEGPLPFAFLQALATNNTLGICQ